MAIIGTPITVTHPGAINMLETTRAQQYALMQEAYLGVVTRYMHLNSVFSPRIAMPQLDNTNIWIEKAVGKSTLQELKEGEAPQGIKTEFSKTTYRVEIPIISRETYSMWGKKQTDFDLNSELAYAQAEEFLNHKDSSLTMIGIKAARMLTSPFGNGVADKPKGHVGGTQHLLASKLDAMDPAKLYQGLIDLNLKVQYKRIQPTRAGMFILMPPKYYSVLQQANYIVNRDYITSIGNKINSGDVMHHLGIPIVSHLAYPQEYVVQHLMNTTFNESIFNGDYRNSVALLIAPEAITARYAIPQSTDLFFDRLSKTYIQDTWSMWAAGVRAPMYAAELAYPADPAPSGAAGTPVPPTSV